MAKTDSSIAYVPYVEVDDGIKKLFSDIDETANHSNDNELKNAYETYKDTNDDSRVIDKDYMMKLFTIAGIIDSNGNIIDSSFANVIGILSIYNNQLMNKNSSNFQAIEMAAKL